MTVKDILDVVKTDSIIIANANDILVNCESPYVKQACELYYDCEIDYIVPLNNRLEITIK